jgi:pyruvate formate lyase activating enzyme
MVNIYLIYTMDCTVCTEESTFPMETQTDTCTRRHLLRRFVRRGAKILLGIPLITYGFAGIHEASAQSPKKQKKDKEPEADSSDEKQLEAYKYMKEAMYYTKLAHARAQCELCFRECIIYEGERGDCRNRENKQGILYSIVYAKPSAIQVDPIEKEPQYHMLPGTNILCFGTAGCNFRCRFCQNWHLSQRSLEEMEYYYLLNPEGVVKLAQERKIPTISFTYNEPTSFYEWVYDISRLAKSSGLNILWHTNGAMKPEPLRELLTYTDAVTVDLKGFREHVYTRYSSAELGPVLNTLQIIRDEGIWLEIVNLMIPTVNDDPDDVRQMCRWIVEELGHEVPLHFSRFFPAYRLTNIHPTPVETLERAYRIARDAGLHYVTVGNVPGHRYNSTFCPSCGSMLIRRTHFHVIENHIHKGRCSSCGHTVPGLWKI